MHRTPVRRLTALVSLALFLLGNNFCLFAVGESAACPLVPAAMKATPAHACCARAAAKSNREAEATREATAPCCVAVSPTVVAHGATLDAMPALSPALAALPAFALPAPTVPALRVLLEDARPPAAHAATPAAGRAPPRL